MPSGDVPVDRNIIRRARRAAWAAALLPALLVAAGVLVLAGIAAHGPRGTPLDAAASYLQAPGRVVLGAFLCPIIVGVVQFAIFALGRIGLLRGAPLRAAEPVPPARPEGGIFHHGAQ